MARLPNWHGGTRDQFIRALAHYCRQVGVTYNAQISYILATVEHETGIFRPVEISTP